MKENRVLISIAVVAGLFLIVPVASYINMYGDNLVYSHEKWAQFGDFFGGVLNPVYALLAFIALLYTINLQRTELRQARNEFRRSADALTDQGKSIEKQNFESTFFHLLNTHNNIVSSIDLQSEKGKVTTGRDCFRVFYTRLTKTFRQNQQKFKNKTDRQMLDSAYRSFWKDHQTELGHYFRYLFNIIRFLDESQYSEGPYIKFLRAQLSDQELLLLFYNCLSPQGAPFIEYVYRYKLFDNLPKVRLLEAQHQDYILSDAWTS